MYLSNGPRTVSSFKDWLQSEEPLIVAGGYVVELERRGYVRGGDFVPEVVVEHPEVVRQLHEEFVHAGSDVTLAVTYNSFKSKLDVHGTEHTVEKLNRKALEIAKDVASRTGTFFAGAICKTNTFSVSEAAEAEIRETYEEQIEFAASAGVEYLVAETMDTFLEAKVAIEIAKRKGLPIVVTFHLYRPEAMLELEGMSVVEACKLAEEAGADVVGVNCGRGPATIVPLLQELRAVCSGPLAVLPACFRTTEREKTWMQLTDRDTGALVYPENISAAQCSVSDIRAFGRTCRNLGIRYVGLCCGNASTFLRALAEEMGRRPPASRFSCQASRSLMRNWVPSAEAKDIK